MMSLTSQHSATVPRADDEPAATAEQKPVQASHDSLTGLPNRRLFAQLLARQLAAAWPRASALLLIDIDGLAAINQTFGRAAGDAALRQLAALLTRLQLPRACVGRVDDGTFAVLLPALGHLHDASAAADKIGQALRLPFQLDGAERVLTVSIGVATYPGDGDDAGALMRCADIALHQAQREGGDRCRHFTPPIDLTRHGREPAGQHGVEPCRAPPMTGHTLLIIDDDPRTLAALQRLLCPEGYRVLAASDTAGAFELLAEQPVQLILCKQRLKETSGTELLEHVRERYPDPFRIILCGCTELAPLMESVNRGTLYRFYLTPWDNSKLRDNIRAAFSHYRQLHPQAVEPALTLPISQRAIEAQQKQQ
jgi:diguanylate cyclase (GGDEF)-like protein